ncbi:MAG: LytTR family DNA-binding domain-containing protein [Oscillospiraceae bacterium]
MSEIFLKIFIADDNPHASNTIKNQINCWAAHLDAKVEIDISESVTNNNEFLSKAADADLVLLDVEMPGMDGITFARLLRDVSSKPAIAYVTSHPEYAIDGYEAQAVAYLVKPTAQQQISALLNKVVRNLNCTKPSKIVFWNKQNKFLIASDDIIYVEARGHSCTVVTGGGLQEFPISFAELQNKLPVPPFLRCHRGFYINMAHIVRFDALELGMTNDYVVPIGRSYIQEVKDTLMSYVKG